MAVRQLQIIDGMTFAIETDLTPRTLLKFSADAVTCRRCGESEMLSKSIGVRSNAIAYEFLKDHARSCLLITGDRLDAELKGMVKKNVKRKS